MTAWKLQEITIPLKIPKNKVKSSLNKKSCFECSIDLVTVKSKKKGVEDMEFPGELKK